MYIILYLIHKINIIIVSIITFICNMYGKRLFEIDNIISKNVFLHDKNTFIFNPIHINTFTYYYGSNYLNFNNIHITDFSASFPWKSILSKNTIFSIQYIQMNLSIIQQNIIKHIHSFSFCNENIYLLESINLIKQIIIKYVHNIIIQINQIKLLINDNLTITFKNIYYDNKLLIIDKVKIFTNTKLHCLINNINSSNDINIDSIIFSSSLFEYLPSFSSTNSIQKIYYNLFLKKIIFDELIIDDIHFIISNKIIINSCRKCSISNIMQLSFDFNKYLIKIKSNSIYFNTDINIELYDIDLFYKWIINIKKYLKIIKNKIIYNSHYQENNIYAIKINILYYNEKIFFDILSINIYENINIVDFNINYNDSILYIKNINISDTEILLHEFSIKDSQFISTISTIQYILHNNQIMFYNLCANNVNIMIDFIKDIVSKFTTDDNNNNNIILIFYDSIINMYYNNYLITSHIKNISYHINKKCIFDSVFSILINEKKIVNIVLINADSENINLKLIDIYLDPDINKLIEEIKNTNNKDVDLLATSIIVDNIEELEKKLSNKIIPNVILNDCINIIEDYEFNEKIISIKHFNIHINSIHFYLFENNKQSEYFMYGIIKKTSISKTIENNDIQKYTISLNTIAIVDSSCTNPMWRYFIKSQHNAIKCITEINNNKIKIFININPLLANIREKTLIKLVSFFNKKKQVESNIHILLFQLNELQIRINYYPIMIESAIATDMLTLDNYLLKLSPLYLRNNYNFNDILIKIQNQWKKDFNPDNFIYFIPNIKFIKPYASPISDFICYTRDYLINKNNKSKLQIINQNIQNTSEVVAETLYNICKFLIG